MKKWKRVFTHVSVDVDNVLSLWFALRFIIKEEVDFYFVSAAWDGKDMKEDDLALDISAGGKGIKGFIDDKNRVHSCFKSLFEEYSNEKTKRVLGDLVTLVDQYDTYGLNNNGTIRNDFFITIINALKALKEIYDNDDKIICQRMFEILDGLFKIKEMDLEPRSKFFPSIIIVGKTAITIREENSRYSARKYLFQMSYDSLIYIQGNNLGILFKDDLVEKGIRADHPKIKKVIEGAGELDDWFAHPAGYMFSWGSRKAPKDKMSSVDPYELAKVIEEIKKNT